MMTLATLFKSNMWVIALGVPDIVPGSSEFSVREFLQLAYIWSRNCMKSQDYVTDTEPRGSCLLIYKLA